MAEIKGVKVGKMYILIFDPEICAPMGEFNRFQFSGDGLKVKMN